MKSLILFLMIVGIVMLALGYQKKLIANTEVKTVVEYRFIPRSIYDEQFSSVKLENTYTDMFDKEDVFLRRV
jgi:hypothetical protein